MLNILRRLIVYLSEECNSDQQSKVIHEDDDAERSGEHTKYCLAP